MKLTAIGICIDERTGAQKVKSKMICGLRKFLSFLMNKIIFILKS